MTLFLQIGIISLVCLTSCFSRSAYMTHGAYEGIQPGTTLSTLTAEVGKPYAVHVKEEGVEEYEYIERIDVGGNLVAENHYFILVKDREVIGKYMRQEKPPAYNLIYQEEPNYP